jgi:hypothetical protein
MDMFPQGTMTLASEYQCDELFARARTFAASRFHEVLEAAGEAFLALSHPTLVALLQSDELKVEEESHVARAALRCVCAAGQG